MDNIVDPNLRSRLTQIETPIDATFTPQPDITAYELAQILNHFHGQPMYEIGWTHLGAMQRHFKRA